jgi:UDP-N-acetylglucosamine 2-epimerase (non-hydrolysing)
MKHASVILTDSGGVQEEACILKTPCVTLRDNTERPETISVGSNVIAGTFPDKIVETSIRMLSVERRWDIPFGDGMAARRIIDIVEFALERGVRLADISTLSRSEQGIDENRNHEV